MILNRSVTRDVMSFNLKVKKLNWSLHGWDFQYSRARHSRFIEQECLE